MAEVESKLLVISKLHHDELVKESKMLQALIQSGINHWENYQAALNIVKDEVPAIMPAYEPKPLPPVGPPAPPPEEYMPEVPPYVPPANTVIP